MEDTGWIKLHRKILTWEWYGDVNVRALFLHLLLTVNYEDKKWHGKNIKRGSIITSLSHLAKQAGLSVRQVRVALDKLKMTGEVTNHSTNKYRIITISNYNGYQTRDKQHDKQVTSKRQTNDKQMTTTKEVKKLRSKEIKKGESNTLNFEKLSGELGVSTNTISKYLQKIQDYEASSGKKYRDYSATIRMWVRRDVDEGKLKISDHKPIPQAEIDRYERLAKEASYV